MTRHSRIIYMITCIGVIIISCTHLKQAKDSYIDENYDQTIAYCEQALKTDSSDTDALLLMGKSYRQKGQLLKALDITRKAYKLSGGSKNIRDELVTIHTALGDENLPDHKYAAVNHYREANKLKPKQKNIQEKLASTYYDLGVLKKAKSYYLKIKNKKNESEISKTISEIDERITESQTLYQKGLLQYKRSRLKNALYYFNKASELYSGSEDIQYHLFLTRGRQLYEKGSVSDLWDAIELFGKASALKKEKGESWYWMGLAYHKKDKNEFTNAIDCLSRALQLEPDADFSQKCRAKLQEIKKRKNKMDDFWGK